MPAPILPILTHVSELKNSVLFCAFFCQKRVIFSLFFTFLHFFCVFSSFFVFFGRFFYPHPDFQPRIKGTLKPPYKTTPIFSLKTPIAKTRNFPLCKFFKVAFSVYQAHRPSYDSYVLYREIYHPESLLHTR